MEHKNFYMNTCAFTAPVFVEYQNFYMNTCAFTAPVSVEYKNFYMNTCAFTVSDAHSAHMNVNVCMLHAAGNVSTQVW